MFIPNIRITGNFAKLLAAAAMDPNCLWGQKLVLVTVIRIRRCTLCYLLNLPVGRCEEANAVGHAVYPEKPGSFGEAHQFMG